MTKLTQDLSIAQALSLIDSYAFDVGENKPEELLQSWLDTYNASWIRLATIEALYLGRYKTISIQHILNVWLRLGNPNPHFTHEFERLICRKLPKHLIGVHDFADGLSDSSAKATINETNEPTLSTDSKAEPKTSHNPNQQLSVEAQESKYATLPSPEKISSSRTPSLEDYSETDKLLDIQPPENPKQDLSSAVQASFNTTASMSLISALGIPYQPDWLPFTGEHTPIHKFIPLPDVSSFFNKLKAFAE